MTSRRLRETTRSKPSLFASSIRDSFFSPFVVSSVAFAFVAALLEQERRAYCTQCFFEMLFVDGFGYGPFAHCVHSRLAHQTFQVCSAVAFSFPCEFVEVHVLAQRHFRGMHFEDVRPSFFFGRWHYQQLVETAWAKQC